MAQTPARQTPVTQAIAAMQAAEEIAAAMQGRAATAAEIVVHFKGEKRWIS